MGIVASRPDDPDAALYLKDPTKFNGFIGALAEASSNGIQPAVEHYFDKIARQLLKYEEQNSLHLQKLVIEPLSKLYNHDIKLAESKRKDFEEESKDYYAYVGRYLGQRQDSLKHKKRAESDSKYQTKRRNFELKRFDYSSFMQDLHGGRKEQEMLSHLTRYANFQARSYLATAKNIEAMMPQLEALVDEVTKADKEFEFQRTEREEKRRTLEKSAKAYVEPEMLAPQGPTTPGMTTTSDFDLSRADSTASQARGKNTPSSVPTNHSATAAPSGLCRRITVGGRPNYVRDTSGNAYEDNPAKLLQMIRDADPMNKTCADCGSTSKVEWVSINLGMVFCIECSGIHRSLGTHISKVRSLTLDVHSFTIDIVELLIQIGNRVGNSVWEGRLDPSVKPLPSSTREERLKFITAKYAERAFVQELSPTLSRYSTPNETLIASIKKNDIEGVLYGIALRADLNATDRSRSTRAFFLALAAADPASPSQSMRNIPPNSGSSSSTTTGFKATEPRSISFPIAELLVQNGAEVPTTAPPIPLSTAAQTYYTQRSSRAARQSPIKFNSHNSPGEVSSSNKVHSSNSTAARVENLSSSLQSNYEGKDREKANKRGSAGARFAGKVASLGLDR
ncbi:Arf GTPase activating protein [Ascosphaera apis ARSEF 7405]|uniref:ADP-ribosylation factor GTPase-activating protein n=1 Tax=Ascosphaera apis ARSEF 7405 TaxID=392613 RepID=A0A168A5Z8_9EURO|nr:Arf GTPase activating protein [Ascosphaera apis ARSEF 7405]